eukprot:6284865-Pyramimonas_sp.AAC.1
MGVWCPPPATLHVLLTGTLGPRASPHNYFACVLDWDARPARTRRFAGTRTIPVKGTMRSDRFCREEHCA